MLATTDIFLQRLVALREYGFPLAEQMERERRLNLDTFRGESSCGTVACLLGWWETTEYARADGWAFAQGVPQSGPLSADTGETYFGISERQWFSLFGTSNFGTLADRRAYLDKLIEMRMAKVAA